MNFPAWRLPVVPIVLANAALCALLGFLLGPSFGPWGDSFTIPIQFGALCLVAVVGALQVRFLILPPMLATAAERARAGQPDAQETVAAARILVMTFSMAPSIYGLVASVFGGNGLLGLPLVGLSLAALALTLPYVDDQADSIRQELRSRGLA